MFLYLHVLFFFGVVVAGSTHYAKEIIAALLLVVLDNALRCVRVWIYVDVCARAYSMNSCSEAVVEAHHGRTRMRPPTTSICASVQGMLSPAPHMHSHAYVLPLACLFSLHHHHAPLQVLLAGPTAVQAHGHGRSRANAWPGRKSRLQARRPQVCV